MGRGATRWSILAAAVAVFGVVRPAAADSTCDALIERWRSERDLAKKTILYENMPDACRVQFTEGHVPEDPEPASGDAPIPLGAPPGLMPKAPPPRVGVPKHILGLDGGVTLGPVLTLGGGLRYENRYWQRATLVGRLLGNTGIHIESEGNGFYSTAAQLGIRRYTPNGHGYFLAEAGIAMVRVRESADLDDFPVPAKTTLLPSAQIGFGIRGAVLNVSVSFWFPFLGLNLQVGFESARF